MRKQLPCGHTIEADTEEGLRKAEVIHHKYVKHEKKASSQGICPDCGSTLFHEEGCASCHACGYSKC